MLANVGEPLDPGWHGGELLELGDGEQPIARFVRHAPSLLPGDPAAGATLRARFTSFRAGELTIGVLRGLPRPRFAGWSERCMPPSH